MDAVATAKEKMTKTVAALERDLGTLKAGRANPQALDRIMVDYYGSQVPINQLGLIRLVFPELTEERRKELVKLVRKKGEESKVAIRSIRRDAIDTIKKAKKDGDITEDDQKRQEEQAQKATDEFIKNIDKVIADKEKEIMTV